MQHTILLAGLPKMNGTRADNIVEGGLSARNCLYLAKFHADVLCLDTLLTQAHLDDLVGMHRVSGGKTRRGGKLTPFTAA